MIPEQTRQLVLEQQEYVTAMRREFHRHPELSSREYDTGRVIVRELESMGIGRCREIYQEAYETYLKNQNA